MSEKAFSEEKNIDKSTKLKILAVNTAKSIVRDCPLAYFKMLSIEDGSGLPPEFWKKDMQKYIDKNEKIIDIHKKI